MIVCVQTRMIVETIIPYLGRLNGALAFFKDPDATQSECAQAKGKCFLLQMSCKMSVSVEMIFH